MAIGPKKIEIAFIEEAKEFEIKIDSILTSMKLTPGGELYVDAPQGMTYQHFNALRQNYIDAGWKTVKWNNSQKDGTSITFSMKPVYTQYDR